MNRYLSLIVAAILLLGACSPSQVSPTTTVSASPTTSVSASATTTTEAPSDSSTTTQQTAQFPYHVANAGELASPDPLPGSDGAHGSGCAPGPGDLPDGIWFGFVLAKEGPDLTFNLACFFTGDLAGEKAIAAGEEPLDFFISDENPATRVVPLVETATVWSITGDPTEGLAPVPIEQWPSKENTYTVCPGQYCAVWLYVNDGVITEIAEQYLP